MPLKALHLHYKRTKKLQVINTPTYFEKVSVSKKKCNMTLTPEMQLLRWL